MCNHYDAEDLNYQEQIKFLEWTKKAARAQVLTTQLWNPVRSAWPRSEMPVVVESEAREIVPMRWGVWPFYSAAKPTYVTNARDDGLLTRAPASRCSTSNSSKVKSITARAASVP